MIALLLIILTLGAVLLLGFLASVVHRRWTDRTDSATGEQHDPSPRPRLRYTMLLGRRAPIEHVAADLRRLRHLVANLHGRSAVRQMAGLGAYDQVLRDGAAILHIEHTLDRCAGMEREFERVRVEAELERAGLSLGRPKHARAA